MRRIVARNVYGMLAIVVSVSTSLVILDLCECLKFFGRGRYFILLAPPFAAGFIGSLIMRGSPRLDIVFVSLGAIGGLYSYLLYDYYTLNVVPDLVVVSYGATVASVTAYVALAVVGYGLGKSFREHDEESM